MNEVQLSQHFTLADLTVTNREEFQTENRILDDHQIQNLRCVAGLVEVAWQILAVAFPQTFQIEIHSGYRCEALNLAVGSNDRSQHLKAEAADWVPNGIELDAAFRVLWKKVRDGSFPVGQMIYETAERSYGPTSWIHLSLGAPWRDAAKCNQVLRMEHGKYELLGNP